MFTQFQTDHPAVLAFDAKGKISADDYKTTLIPALEAAAQDHGKVGILIRFGPEFEGYTLSGMAEDTVFGLGHFNSFSRIAVVTDIGWIRKGMEVFAHLMPMPVKLFDAEDVMPALAWLKDTGA